ncbi:MAG: hypothetical protein IT365_05185 [Candidatus Hydrogenedentes bacterium]|nr:hypothetical protein [Candidatus Hydrogenedentota bacterium]
MTTTRDRLRDSLEEILLATWSDITAQISQIDEKALSLLNDEQILRLHELVIDAAARCANFAAAFYCDGGDMLSVRGNIEKVTFQPGKGVTVAVAALNTTHNIMALAEMGSGVSIHGLQTVIPDTVINAETVLEAMEHEVQMDLDEAEAGEQTEAETQVTERSEDEDLTCNSDHSASGEPTREEILAENVPARRGRPRKQR